MSAKAHALQLPGRGPAHRSQWYAVVAALLGVAVAVTVFALVSRNTATAPAPARPAVHQQVNEGTAPADIQPVSGVDRVGGTSIYRFHPLPATNVFQPSRHANGGGAVSGTRPVGADPRVGGTGTYQFHPLA
jgi:hypothetical protein